MFTYTHNRISHIILTITVGVLACVVFMVSQVTEAAPSYTINYQGKLTNASNVAVANGTYNMRFWITTSPTIATTSALWTEELTGTNKVQVTNGLFSIMLGSTTPLTGIDWNQPLYLGVEVGGTTTPAWDGEMSPRKILGTVPSAFEAKNAQTLGGIATTSLLRSDQDDTASGLLTFTGGLISNSSTTITNLTSLIATTTTLVINGSPFTSLTGTGLTNNSGVLTATLGTDITAGEIADGDHGFLSYTSGVASLDANGLTSSNLLSALSDETGTNNLVFSTNPLLSGFRSNASSTIGDGTDAGGLTISGNATTTGNAYFAGSLGIGTTSPSGVLSIASSTNAFVVAQNGGLTITRGTDSAISPLRIDISSSVGTTDFIDAIANRALGYGISLENTNSSGNVYHRMRVGDADFSFTLTDIGSNSGRVGFDGESANVLTLLTSSGSIGIGTTTPTSKLTIQGSGTTNPFLVASSTGSTTLAVLASGDVEIPGNLISAGINWTARSAPASTWTSVAYGNGLFVAVGTNVIATSPDGVTWTSRIVSGNDDSWKSITYGNGLFVALGTGDGVGGGNSIATSHDGITWTESSIAGLGWSSVTYGNGLFVGVKGGGIGTQPMTSYDGSTWTTGSAAGNNDAWNSIIYGNGLFVAVGSSGDRVMYSGNGISWATTTAASDNDSWQSVTYGNGLFVAVSSSGDRVMTSPDGITWTARSALGDDDSWTSVTYGNGLFVAVSSSGDRVMTSPDGINWTVRVATGNDDSWNEIAYGNGLFVAVGSSGDRVMTSGKTYTNALAHNNVYQGGMSVLGGPFNIGTTTASTSAYASNVLNITSTTGTSLLTMLQNGYLGIGSSTPSRLLTVAGDGYFSGHLTVASSTLGYASSTALTVSGNSYVGGRFSIGSTSPESSTFTIDKSALTGSVVGGVKEYLAYINSTLNAVYYGDNAYIVNTPTATSTLVGSILRIEDNSTLGNTVRGMEAQAYRGTNTKGENTGLAGFGRTFGVRGTTLGDAGSVYLPAGVFAESQGTTQGNALRAYSGTLTSETLVSFFHDTSAFTGTGLNMNFGNSGGSFTGTGAKFLDFQIGGTSKFMVTAQGTTTIGDGTTANMAGLQIGYGGLCVDNDGSCTASTTGRITSVSSASGNSDLAEMYFGPRTLEAGEIVASVGNLSIARAEEGSTILGVVSTKPGLIMGYDDISLSEGEVAHPVALKGRVPVKLSTENGPIHKGDRIALSSIPGVGMKATEHSTVVGIALEDYTGDYAYSETYLNQFGDDLVKAKLQPLNQETDSRTQDGCSYGGGVAQGETPCVKDRVSPVRPTTITVDNKTEVLNTLKNQSATTTETPEGQEVTIGYAVMFVHLSEFFQESERLVLKELISTSTVISGNGTETLWDRVKALAQNFVDGVLTLAGLKADKVETSELCVDGVCVTASDLRVLLEGVQGGNSEPEEVVPAEPEPTPSEPTDTSPSSDGASAGGSSSEVTAQETPSSPAETTIEVIPTEESPITEPTSEPPINETISP